MKFLVAILVLTICFTAIVVVESQNSGSDGQQQPIIDAQLPQINLPKIPPVIEAGRRRRALAHN